jgi:hypothetical protein
MFEASTRINFTATNVIPFLRQTFLIRALGNAENLLHDREPSEILLLKVVMFKTISVLGVVHAVTVTINIRLTDKKARNSLGIRKNF